MKAIHNGAEIKQHKLNIGNYKLKYNFESNSQQPLRPVTYIEHWKL
ncbi:hypothetical protein RRM46_002207 [Flavobacterium psychrophilum]|nr:hypothetical protein [Flavobacterium psychrophilum]